VASAATPGATSDPASADPLANRSRPMVEVDADEFERLMTEDDDRLTVDRYTFEQTKPTVELQPALADRAVISRPDRPLHVPPGETVTIYLSTPLWVRVYFPESDRLLCEIPCYRMSDTWFGRSTTDGELCYAARTSGRLRLDRLPIRLHRAVTPATVANSADEPLLLERLQLPTPHLALYRSPENTLWTQAIEMIRTQAGKGADVSVTRGSPPQISDGTLVQEPRISSKKGLFTSTFTAVESLFGA
ncbi:MAG: hypothetical protein ABEL76_07765, partial [Bradymonadaceae bacterium]